jgi:hypothetical protein
MTGCVKVDNSLGKGLVDKSLLFDTYTVEFPLEEITLERASDLSAFSDSRLTLGAIRDDCFGLTTREAAFTLVPVLDTLDLGTNPVAQSFRIYFEADTVSLADETQRHIIQSIYVTELEEAVPTSITSTNQPLKHGTARVTDGIPVYNGVSGALTFNFTKEFAQKYVDVVKKLGPVLKDRQSDNGVDHYDDFVKELPGIHLRTDVPSGLGGRINLFDFSCLSVESSYYTRNNNVAALTVHSTWNGVQKDSTFLFLPGETEFVDEAAYLAANTKFYQYCYNYTYHSTEDRPAVDYIYVEGGGGLKPVIHAQELQEKTRAAILAHGGNPDKVAIIKATIILPFEMPEDYKELDRFPSVLSPTIRVKSESDEGEESISFAGLTDASVSSENQGNIDRSNLWYAPDITYHLQELLTRTDLDSESDGDIWLLTIHTEQVADANGSAYDNEYYQNLLYASYYNALYGGGYGGYYGGYGGYGYGNNYSNYYSYMMLAQMMAASSQQTYSYTTELDKDRYYKAVMNGPASNGEAGVPFFRVTFAIPQD